MSFQLRNPFSFTKNEKKRDIEIESFVDLRPMGGSKVVVYAAIYCLLSIVKRGICDFSRGFLAGQPKGLSKLADRHDYWTLFLAS